MSFVTNDATARTDPSPMVSVLPGEAAITQFVPTKAFLPKTIVPGPEYARLRSCAGRSAPHHEFQYIPGIHSPGTHRHQCKPSRESLHLVDDVERGGARMPQVASVPTGAAVDCRLFWRKTLAYLISVRSHCLPGCWQAASVPWNPGRECRLVWNRL